jgi:P4 family phage/plasmid primase-like protien
MIDILKYLYAVFGDVVLLPIGFKTKKPLDTAWQKISFDDTQTPEYHARLETAVRDGGNIGVALGPCSDGLMAIDIDRDELVPEFLRINPALAITTRTRGARGCQFFLRLIPGTDYPNTKAVYTLKDSSGAKYGEWRCGGGGLGAQSVVFGVHPDGMNYHFVVEAPPLELDFSQIQWLAPWNSSSQTTSGGAAQTTSGAAAYVPHPPAGSHTASGPQIDLQAVYLKLFSVFGDPFIRTTPKTYCVNQLFFARLWGAKRLAFYEQTTEDFYAYNAANGLHERLRNDDVTGILSTDIITEGFNRGFQNVAGKINSALLNSIVAIIKGDREVCRKNFFALDPSRPPVIHAANGMVCIENDGAILREFDPNYRSRNQIPIDYIKGAPCINFREKLLEPVLSDVDIDLLQRYCGLILIGGNRAQKILMMLGGGGTSKGTVTRLITLVIGRRNVIQLRVDQLSDRFETARLVGKLLLNVVEASANYLNREGAEIVKALCGHDHMDGEKKYTNEPISFDGTFPIIVTSNEQLNVRLAGDETAQRRRLAIIEFPSQRPAGAEVIEHFEQQLYDEESEGIFAWMIEGAVKHWQELKLKKGFVLSATQQKRVEDLIGRSKSVETFVMTKLEASGSEDVTSEELYDAYSGFCAASKWMPFLEQRFEEMSRYLIQREFGIGKRNDILRPDRYGKMRNRRGYGGIKIKI